MPMVELPALVPLRLWRWRRWWYFWINVFNDEETSVGVTTIISFNDNLTAASIGNTTVSVTGVLHL